MKRIRYFDRKTATAAILGVLTLITNFASYAIFPDLLLPIGNLFLFWSASTLGPVGASITAGIGIFPDSLLRGDDHVYGIRTLALCLAIAYCNERKPNVPAYAVTAGAWFACFGPLLYALSQNGPLHYTSRYLVLAAYTEVLMTMLSGCLLLSHTVWGSITHKPRHVSASQLLLHIIPFAAMGSIMAALSVAGGGYALRLDHFGPSLFSMSCFFITALLASMGFACWLAQHMRRYQSQLFAGNLLAGGRTHSFSGLSSDYWRRASDQRAPTGTALAPDGRTLSQTGVQVARNFSPEQGICALNKNGSVQFINRKFRSLCELQDNEPLGKRLETLHMRAEIKTALEKLLERTFCKGTGSIELKLNELPERLRYLEITSKQADDFEGSSIASDANTAIFTVRDITDRRVVEQHLLRGQRLASLGNFISGLTHSFNNSLTTISGQASFARVTDKPELLKQALDQILGAARKAGALVRKLQEYADGRSGSAVTTDLGGHIKGHMDLLRNAVGENAELTLHEPPGPLGAAFDPNLMLQALTNLLINSKEALGGNPGKIDIMIDTEVLDEEVADFIAGARAGRFVRLRIKDSGFGMSSETLARACDPLYTTKGDKGHSGLGLSIVYAIVRAHNGFLSIESSPRKGTTVSIYLPECELRAADAAAPAQTAVQSEGAPEAEKAATILVVEDDQQVRDAVCKMLTRIGYTATGCENASEALDCYQKQRFDLVLIDMVMPRMNGPELIASLKKTDDKAKMIVMTGHGSAGRAGDMPVIPKPFELDTLARAVAQELERVQ